MRRFRRRPPVQDSTASMSDQWLSEVLSRTRWVSLVKTAGEDVLLSGSAGIDDMGIEERFRLSSLSSVSDLIHQARNHRRFEGTHFASNLLPGDQTAALQAQSLELRKVMPSPCRVSPQVSQQAVRVQV